VEIALGLFSDSVAGPGEVIGAGGSLIEYFRDRIFASPPFGPANARELIGRLALGAVLKGARGRSPADIEQLANVVSNFSLLCAGLSDRLVEIDVNPIIVTPTAAVAVDGLVVSGDSAN